MGAMSSPKVRGGGQMPPTADIDGEPIDLSGVPTLFGGQPVADVGMGFAELEQFAAQLERGLQALSLQVDQVVVRVKVLRELCATGIRKSRAAEVVAVPARVRLTPHEGLVLQLAAAGRDNSEIAAALHVAPDTVKSQLRAAFRKLGVHSRAGAVRFVVDNHPNGGFRHPGSEFTPNG